MNSKTAVTLLVLPCYLLANINEYDFKIPKDAPKMSWTTTTQTVLPLGNQFLFTCQFDCNCTRGIRFTSCNGSVVDTWMYHFVGGRDTLEYDVQVKDTSRTPNGHAQRTNNGYVSYIALGIRKYEVNHTGTYDCFVYVNNTMNITTSTQLSPMGDIYVLILNGKNFFAVQCVFHVCFPGMVSLLTGSATVFEPTVRLCNGTNVVSEYVASTRTANPTFQCRINSTQCSLTSHSQIWNSTSSKHKSWRLNTENCKNYSYPTRTTMQPTTNVQPLLTVPFNTLNSSDNYNHEARKASRELHSLWMLIVIAATVLGLWFLRIPQALMEKMRGYRKPLRIANDE